jgi:hypothetical protein
MQYLTKESILPFGIGVLVSGVLFYFICKAQSSPTGSVGASLIDNATAISMIKNYNPCDTSDTATISGHLEIGALLGYIDEATTKCETLGFELSGLEYYFAKYIDELENRRTIVIYPTVQEIEADGTVHHIPFDPFLSTSADTMTVVEINLDNLKTRSIFESKHVLDRSHMSPPRKPTF